AGRKVDYARIDPAAAREIFLRAALVEGELKGSFGFLDHNRALLENIDALESRLRRRGLSPDDETLYAFYDQRVGKICDQRSFARMLKEQGSDDFLRLREEDLLAAVPAQEALEPFPETLRVGDVELALSYRFEPGREDDGVSVAVPAALAPHLPAEAFEWLVPGLLEEKVTLLLKGLPKRLRKTVIPVPRTAAELLEELVPGSGSLYAQLQELLLRRFRLRVQRSDWAVASLPAHLTVRYCLQGPDGNTVTATRSYAELLAACDPNRGAGAGDAGGGPSAGLEAARREWEREGLTDHDFPDLPERISLGPSPVGVEGFAFPGLAREERGVALRLFGTRAESVESTRNGLLALYGARFTAELSVLRKDLAIARSRWPLFEGLGSQEAVSRDLLAFVLAEAFGTRDGRLPDRSTFQARVASLKGGALFNRSREVRDQIMEVLQLRRDVLDLLARHRREGGTDAARVPALAAELERILPGDFLRTLHGGRLPDLLRYLKALHLRIKRAHLSPAKDAQRQAQVEPHLERLAAARDAGPLTTEQADLVVELARMLEEFRVSLFAQEVGTAFPISAKRLDKKWEEIRGAIEIRPGGPRR
ncbi:MAG: DUF3418 domain-containing protein, partial [Deferrisomatales bacterium]|nr:DUF3418 domain-containing protein [Deferrisomatales bacterium]